jgi:hypothetical protein
MFLDCLLLAGQLGPVRLGSQPWRTLFTERALVRLPALYHPLHQRHDNSARFDRQSIWPMYDCNDFGKESYWARVPVSDGLLHLVRGLQSGDEFLTLQHRCPFRDDESRPDHVLRILGVFFGEPMFGSHQLSQMVREGDGCVGATHHPVRVDAPLKGFHCELLGQPAADLRIRENWRRVDIPVRASSAREFSVRRPWVAVVVEEPHGVALTVELKHFLVSHWSHCNTSFVVA